MRTLLVLSILVASAAFADDDVPGRSYGEALAVSAGTASDIADGWIIPPGKTGTLDTQLAFLSANKIAFTDVGLLRMHGDYSIKGRVELNAGAELLIKEPSNASEDVLQKLDLSASLRVGPSWAVGVGGTGGPLMGGAGEWAEADALVHAKDLLDELDRTLMLELDAGLSGTQLFLAGQPDFAFAEVVASAKAELRIPNGAAALWLGADYHGPIARTQTPGFDPRVRLGFEIGTVYAVAPSWDLYVQFDVIDRGDPANPATTLPILDGGFDQRQFIVGLTKHWPSRKRDWW